MSKKRPRPSPPEKTAMPPPAHKKAPGNVAKIGHPNDAAEGNTGNPKNSSTAITTPEPNARTHPNRPDLWAPQLGEKKNFPFMDSLGVIDRGAFAMTGHHRAAMKCLWEGTVGVFSPEATFVEGDIVYIFLHNGDQHFGRIFYPDRRHVVIVGDHGRYHADVLHRADIKSYAALVQIRRDVPHGHNCRGWHRYANDPKNRRSKAPFGEAEKRVDSHITADRLFAQFKKIGQTKGELATLPKDEPTEPATAKLPRAGIPVLRPHEAWDGGVR